MDTSWRAHLDAFPNALSPEDTRALSDALASCRPGDRMRGMLMRVLDAIAAAQGEEAERDFARFSSRFPSHAFFAWAPIPEVLLKLAFIGNLVYPERPLQSACNEIVFLRSKALFDLSLFRPLFIACEGSFNRFLATVPGSMELVFEGGAADIVEDHPGEVVIAYDDLPALANVYFSPGINRGLFRSFGLEGEARLEFFSPYRYEIHFSWSTPAA